MHDPVPDTLKSTATWAAQEVDQLFTRLARYTRFVVLSKWFLMLFAVGLMAALIAVPLVSKDRSGIRVSFIDKKLTGKDPASSPVMNHPEYSATSDKGDQFNVKGIRAMQISASRITVEGVEAQMIAADGSWRSLTAGRAEYDQAARTILLTGHVALLDAQGHSFTTESARVNLATMEVEGDQPIQGVGPLGNLLASTFKIMDSGKRIIFYGGTTPLKLTIERNRRA